MFINAERLDAFHAEHDDEEIKVITIVPDLAIEIISPNDSYSDVRQKVQWYLQDGVRQVWVIDPKTKTVTIHEGNHGQELTDDQALDGGEILPGFSIHIAALFAKPGEKK
jgi:Uma2 family endonuclease